MRRIAKLAAVGAIGAALVGFGASAASATSFGHQHQHVTQCTQDQPSTGLGGLIGAGLGLNVLNQCYAYNNN
ncbi:hypothetical protein [Nocardiopsis ansamitocini]|uniref:Uncharacterized protein n=1 Tax=Nocardiopsis ansamitocini TaxID=1670832 RepID=A0A9W6UGA7_9ACTN|nr:hypothetical protein [Nocardiopsis ansamitocini]GLU47041.1 hypothetical protein Nans01_13920 [Nocardiopsis ansamitocini]